MDHSKLPWAASAIGGGSGSGGGGGGGGSVPCHRRVRSPNAVISMSTTSSSSSSSTHTFVEFEKIVQRVYAAESLKDEVDELLQLYDLISPYLGGGHSSTSSSGHSSRKSSQQPKLQFEDLFMESCMGNVDSQ